MAAPLSRALWIAAFASICTDSVKGFAVPTLPIADIPSINLCSEDQATILELRDACHRVGFFAVTGHGISSQTIERAIEVSRGLFDMPLDQKEQLVVGGMMRSRGWEMSPEHRSFSESFRAQYPLDITDGLEAAFVDSYQLSKEPSARAGILNERFCIGPASCPPEYVGQDTQELFFPANVWPPEERVPHLEPVLQELYTEMEKASEKVLLAVAKSLGASEALLEPFLTRHCSNLQIANYPSQLQHEKITSPIRVKAHADSGTVTLLIRQSTSETEARGGLQILTKDGQWAAVPPLPPGAILVNLGNLASLWTGESYVSTKHRVVNPNQPSRNRRVSIAYFQKPDPEAFFVSLAGRHVGGGGTRGGQRVPDARRVRIRELTRVGLLHKYRHLGHEEASRRYHQEMASPYLEGSDDTT